MSTPGTGETHESHQSLWLLTISPTIWAIHFLLCYLTAAIWCAKFGDRVEGLYPVRVATAIFTVMALSGIGITFWRGYLRHSFGGGTTPHDFDTPEDRHRFLGFATVLLSGLSAVATVFVAIVAIFFKNCD